MHAPLKYTPRTTPMSHQAEALRKAAARPSKPCPSDVFAYLMEQGCGKSKVILDEWQAAVGRGDLRDLLVVAPAGCYKNWFIDKNEDQQSELRAHLDPQLFKETIVAGWMKGADAKHDRERIMSGCATGTGRPRALFVNIEALSTGGQAEKLCVDFLSPGRAMFVIDESTCVRGRKAERRKAVMRLRHLAEARRICTGEVAPKSPLDLFWQFYFLDPRILGFDSYVAFQARYAEMKQACFLPNKMIDEMFLKQSGVKSMCSDVTLRNKLTQIYNRADRPVASDMPRQQIKAEIIAAAEGMRREDKIEAISRMAGGGYVRGLVPTIKGYRHVEELQAKIAPYSHRVLKKDALDLKPKIYMPVREVELTTEQKRIYNEMKKNATAELDLMTHVTATTVLSRMMRLHQIACGHTKDENDVLHDIPSNRCAAVLDVLAEHSGKAIIWTCYVPELLKLRAAINKEYGTESCSIYYGGNKIHRDHEERMFLSDPQRRFMVSTQAAGGKGNTWNVATLVVYAANSYDLELRIHSEDRCHRAGQREAVTYVDLSACPVEERIVKALRAKMDLAQLVNGEPDYRKWLI